jgi:hypothetical protein
MGARRLQAISGPIGALLAIVFLAGAVEQEGVVGPERQLAYWIDQGTVPPATSVFESLDATIFEDRQFVLTETGPLVALAVTGRVHLDNARSSVRVVLVDTELHEHLVAEVYPLLAGTQDLALADICRETCLLPAVSAHRLRVAVVDGRIELDRLHLLLAEAPLPDDLAARRERIRGAQSDEIVARLNESLRLHGLDWTAGETTWSRQTYDQRRHRTQGGAVPVLHGYDHYVAGVYELPGYVAVDEGGGGSPSDRFDWREKHDADLPGSPYFDGDPAGSGWMTPIRMQACEDCWAHATLGVAEALANLRLNRHVDADLSEQAMLSCSGAGSCEGGRVSLSFAYMASDGVVDETCFPYEGADAPCSLSCSNPRMKAYAGMYMDVPYELGDAAIRDALVQHGPLVFGIRSLWHLVVLVGYDRDPSDGQRVWIIKNSWGADWGENGYGVIKLPVTDIYAVYALLSVDLLQDGQRLASLCRDADRDGYATWGFKVARPVGCVTIAGLQDCNDADPTLGPAFDDGQCESITSERDVPPDPVPLPTGGGSGGGGGAIGLLQLGVAGLWWAQWRSNTASGQLLDRTASGQARTARLAPTVSGQARLRRTPPTGCEPCCRLVIQQSMGLPARSRAVVRLRPQACWQ